MQFGKDMAVRLVLVDDSVEAAEAIVSGLRNAGVAVRPSRPEDEDQLQALIDGAPQDVVLVAQNSTLITEKDGLRRTVPVDLTSMKRGKAPPAYLKPGDILIVGSSSLAKFAEFIKLSAGASYSPVP